MSTSRGYAPASCRMTMRSSARLLPSQSGMFAACTAAAWRFPNVSVTNSRFSPLIFFCPVESDVASHPPALDRLTIRDQHAWCRLLSLLHPHELIERLIDPLPGTIPPPHVIVVAHATVIRIIVRDHAPLAASPEQ